ncbi:MAG: hypothetical protein NZ700_09000 [Gemmataceae bacterium]|nr:hypothetical protein [Gemmataceae bacterium]MDW8267383.1 hypothetical protein [Gemmataceae bacterium]
MTQHPTAMVVLASEQLWPNIHGLVHWSSHLQHLCIYHTTDERSYKPAQQLALLCRAMYGSRVQVHVPPVPGGMQPLEVHTQIQCWRHQLPGQRWLLNATGGTKLMTAGVLRCVGEPDCQVVYREIADRWYELHRADNGRDIVTSPIDVPVTATDRIPVSSLLCALWNGADHRVEFGSKPNRLPVLELTQAWIKHQGNWSMAFSDCGLPNNEGVGFLFERFIAAVLLELGVSNLVCNVKRLDSTGTQVLQEIDLVANYSGRIRIVDCKLTDGQTGKAKVRGEPITSQIRQAAQTRRELGAELLLLRPNSTLNEAERSLAQAYGLQVLDRDDCNSLFSGLHRFLRVQGPLPETLRQAQEALIQATKVPGANPMQPPAEQNKKLRNVSGQWAVIDLDAYRRDLNQDWVAYRLSDLEVGFKCARLSDISRDQWRWLIQEQFRSFGQVKDIALRKTGSTGRFILTVPNHAKFSALITYLEARLQKSLLIVQPVTK